MKKMLQITSSLLMVGMFYGCGSSLDQPKNDTEEVVIEEVATEEERVEVIEEVATEEEQVEEETPDVMTVENDEEFARMINGPVNDTDIVDFFTEHDMQLIEFDGIIDDVSLLPEKDTRYSVIISTNGATFIVRDVGSSEKSFRDILRSGKAVPGAEVKVLAKNYGYNDGSGLIELKLQLLTEK